MSRDDLDTENPRSSTPIFVWELMAVGGFVGSIAYVGFPEVAAYLGAVLFYGAAAFLHLTNTEVVVDA